MAFLKLRSERAYSTGGVRTFLSKREFAGKLKRLGMPTAVDGERLIVRCGGNLFVFADWQQDGLATTGWLAFTTDDIFELSQRLSNGAIRHRLHWSRPFDLETDEVRCITSFDYLWDAHPFAAGNRRADVQTYDEPVDAAAAAAFAARV
jgi:hypothetical protein